MDDVLALDKVTYLTIIQFQVTACVNALENGVTTVITNGLNQDAIKSAVAGKKVR